MKLATALYVALGTVGLAAAVLVPTVIIRAGTQALPVWASVASPGPLSSAHAFLGSQCESCHTPNVGIKIEACVTCHIADAVTLANQTNAFHATIGECKGCHIEHQGVDARPIKMDHSVLTAVGLRAAQAEVPPGQQAAAAMTAARRFLAGAAGSAAAAEGEGNPTQPMVDSAATARRLQAGLVGSRPALDDGGLNCASCHSFQDKHDGLFGQQCADCHAVETWEVVGFLHPSAKSQECNQCHQAPPSHYMMHFEMMDQAVTGQHGARVEQCYLCHLTNSFNEIKGVGWLKHH